MFNVGEAVIYGNTGVCMIEDIRLEDFLGKKERYYILKPIYTKGSTIFCPVENVKVTMRKTSTRDELDKALSCSDEPSVSWIENDQQRREHLSGILKKCDLGEIAATVRLLYTKKKEKTDCGKKLHAADEKALADAEKILFGEISYVLELDIDEAKELFENNL